MKEIVPLISFSPTPSSAVSFLSGYTDLVRDKELSVISATIELGDELPYVPLDLIKAEYESRKEMIEAISAS